MEGSGSMNGVATFLFWACAAVLVYVYVGYPAVLGIIALFVRRKKVEPGYLPFISFLIAAYNEETGIRRKLEETLALDYPADKFEVLVLSDGSTDGTDEIVKSFSDPRVRLLRMEPRRGKTSAQNRGVRESQGEILVFSDATTAYHPQALRYLAAAFQDPEVGAVTGRNQFFDPEGDSPTGFGTIAFWSYENIIKTLQSRIRTLSGCVGCIYAVRKGVYTDLPEELSSDLAQPLWVVRKGYRVVFEDRALAHEETTKSLGVEFSMRVRVVTGGMWGVLRVPDVLKPWRFGWISFQLFSHKVLRWLVPFFLILMFLSSAMLAKHPWYGSAFFLQAFFYVWALVSMVVPVQRGWKVLGIPLYFCVLNSAALCSVIELFRGEKYVTWETVRTRAVSE